MMVLTADADGDRPVHAGHLRTPADESGMAGRLPAILHPVSRCSEYGPWRWNGHAQTRTRPRTARSFPVCPGGSAGPVGRASPSRSTPVFPPSVPAHPPLASGSRWSIADSPSPQILEPLARARFSHTDYRALVSRPLSQLATMENTPAADPVPPPDQHRAKPVQAPPRSSRDENVHTIVPLGGVAATLPRHSTPAPAPFLLFPNIPAGGSCSPQTHPAAPKKKLCVRQQQTAGQSMTQGQEIIIRYLVLSQCYEIFLAGRPRPVTPDISAFAKRIFRIAHPRQIKPLRRANQPAPRPVPRLQRRLDIVGLPAPQPDPFQRADDTADLMMQK